MHLTTAEVALASTAIGGVIGFLGGGVRDRSSERREHLTRLWEKEVNIYEELLIESGSRHDQYIRTRMAAENIKVINKNWASIVKISRHDDLTTFRRLEAQLTEFGRPEVQHAREKCNAHHEKFLAFIFMIAGEDQAGGRINSADLIEILDGADKAEIFLAETIRDAIRTSPSVRRRKSSGLAVKKRLRSPVN